MTSESLTIDQKRSHMADLEEFAENAAGVLTPGELLTLYYSDCLNYTTTEISKIFFKAPTTVRNQIIAARNKINTLNEDQDYIEQILDEADRLAAETDVRLTHDEVFESLSKEFGLELNDEKI